MTNSRILIVDNHPIITEAYKNSIVNLSSTNKSYLFHIDTALCFDSAVLHLSESTFDVVLLDLNLQAKSDSSLRSGEDLGMHIRKINPKTKIIAVTSYNDPLLVSRILQFLEPEGLLHKGDFNSDGCSKALIDVLRGVPSYSESILKQIRLKLSSKIRLSTKEKILLFELDKGVGTKELSKILHLSVGAVEKRKRNLRDLFGIDVSEDKKLLEAVREKGFI
ncbi:MAG: response regulator transcription factor [Psychroserpens sp.]|nr:response regulator transcription factor [Psychroserpens sp.]